MIQTLTKGLYLLPPPVNMQWRDCRHMSRFLSTLSPDSQPLPSGFQCMSRFCLFVLYGTFWRFSCGQMLNGSIWPKPLAHLAPLDRFLMNYGFPLLRAPIALCLFHRSTGFSNSSHCSWRNGVQCELGSQAASLPALSKLGHWNTSVAVLMVILKLRTGFTALLKVTVLTRHVRKLQQVKRKH